VEANDSLKIAPLDFFTSSLRKRNDLFVSRFGAPIKNKAVSLYFRRSIGLLPKIKGDSHDWANPEAKPAPARPGVLAGTSRRPICLRRVGRYTLWFIRAGADSRLNSPAQQDLHARSRH